MYFSYEVILKHNIIQTSSDYKLNVHFRYNIPTDRGRSFTSSPPLPPAHPLHGAWQEGRGRLCDALSEHCNALAEHIIGAGSLDTVPGDMMVQALKTVTRSRVGGEKWNFFYCLLRW